MNMEKFGRTLLFVFLLLVLFIGLQMLLKVSVPFLRGVDSSLADAVESTM